MNSVTGVLKSTLQRGRGRYENRYKARTPKISSSPQKLRRGREGFFMRALKTENDPVVSLFWNSSL
jgi:hypothetical protein